MTVVPLQRQTKFVDRVLDLRTELRAFEDDDGNRYLEGIATTPRVDRMGDVVVSEGAQFQLPIPLLWQHDPTRPVGNVISASVTAEGIRFRAQFAPEGVMNVIDAHWRELKAGLVRFVSVGFRSLKSRNKNGGLIFDVWEWLELSVVTIPANGDAAITSIKSFAVPERSALPRTAAATAVAVVKAAPAGASASTAPRTGANPMKLSERIAAKKVAITQLKDRLTEVSGAEDIDDAVQAQIDEIARQIDDETKALGALEQAEQALAARTAIVPAPDARVINPATARAPKVKGDLAFKTLTALLYAYVEHRTLADVLNSYYTGHAELEQYIKATSAPADTVTPGWAAELVGETTAGFLESLVPLSVYAALTVKGNRFSFGRFGRVVIPARNTTPNLAGDFIGEGAPIPVKQGSLRSLVLTPKKMAVISTFTRELAQHSTPQIEALIRQMILEDTAQALDTKLLDDVAASTIRPAGLLNGVTLIPSSGVTSAEILADIRAVMAPILTVNGGRRLVWILNPLRVVGLSTVQTAAGTFLYRDEILQGKFFGYEFIASNNVPQDVLILVDAADFASAADDTPEFSVSDVATLHMESDPAAVAPIVGGTAGTPEPAFPVRSLWQTASIGVRMIQPLSWGMRRPGMVTGLSGVAW